jgi:hypothetical protein
LSPCNSKRRKISGVDRFSAGAQARAYSRCCAMALRGISIADLFRAANGS